MGTNLSLFYFPPKCIVLHLPPRGALLILLWFSYLVLKNKACSLMKLLSYLHFLLCNHQHFLQRLELSGCQWQTSVWTTSFWELHCHKDNPWGWGGHGSVAICPWTGTWSALLCLSPIWICHFLPLHMNLAGSRKTDSHVLKRMYPRRKEISYSLASDQKRTAKVGNVQLETSNSSWKRKALCSARSYTTLLE